MCALPCRIPHSKKFTITIRRRKAQKAAPAVQLQTRQSNGILIIAPNGRILTEQDTAEFKDTVKSAMINGNRKVVADLSGVDWMNSTGIGALVNSYTMLKEADGDFHLAALNESVLNVLKINKLNLVFDIHGTVDEALQTLA